MEVVPGVATNWPGAQVIQGWQVVAFSDVAKVPDVQAVQD